MPATLNLDKVNEVKTMLRSLLISNGNREVTLGQLNGLYKEIEGNNIPFREFNYSNLFEFLSTIPDAVVLQHNRDGELIVKHVNTAKSMHISSLVDRQKKPPRKSKSAHRPRYNYSYIKPVQQHYNPSSLNALRQVLQEINNLPAQLKSRGISKSEVLFKIRERLGKFALYTDKHLSAHLNELQHFICVEENYIYFKNELDERTVNHQPFNSTIPVKNSFVSGNSNGLKVELKNDSFQKPVSKSKDVHDTSNKIEQNCCTENTKNANGIAERNCGTKKLQNCNNIFEENFSSKITQNSQETEQNSSVKERRNSRNVEKNSSIQDQCNSQCIDTNSVCDLIKERTKIRLQKLIQNHPEGIWCSELPSVYKKEYEIDLEYIELGFNNITEFVAALPNIFKIVEPPNTNRQMVLDVRKFSCSNIQQTTTMASLYNFDDYIATDPEPIPTRLSSGVSRSLIPEGVMNLNETVEQISVSFLLSEDYIEVLVSEIFTPSFFWITLRENKKKRKTMMSELDEFYRNRNIDEYKIPQVILEPGLNIACVYARVWHRGMIKKIKPDGFVVIFFYDYGTVKTYNPNDLYFLNKKFSTLPAQAIACGLYNLKPIGSNEWPRESVTKFIRKVWDLPLIAMIGDANEESNSMMISLTDTSDDLNDLHIADWMVENKFAEWGKMVSSVPIHKLCSYDELEFQKSKEEEYNQSQVYHNNSNNSINLESAYSRESCQSPNSNSNYLDFCNTIDSPNVATLIQENTDWIKQTNTIAQAILLKQMEENTVENRIGNSFNVELPLSETLNKKFTQDLNSNLSTIKVNISEMNNNYFGDQFLQSEYPKQKSIDNFCYKSSQSLHSNSSSSDCYLEQTKKKNCENETTQSGQYPKRKTSLNSLHSYRSNFDFESVQEDVNNYQKQDCQLEQTKKNNCENGIIESEQYSKRKTSLNSSYSYRPNFDFEPVQEDVNYLEQDNRQKQDSRQHDNCQKQDIDNDSTSSSDIFGENHGTPFYEIKIDNLNKSDQIKFKYPVNFASLHFKKSEGNSNTANSINIENVVRNSSNNNEIDEGYYTRPSTAQTNSKSSSVSNVAVNVPDYTIINLSNRCDNKPIHVFHLDNEGWICGSEFVDAFTNLKDIRVMLSLLRILNFEVDFKHLTRENEPQLFSQLDKSLLKLPCEGNKTAATSSMLTLLPLKSMLQVLVTLDFLTRKMLDKAVPLMKQSKENVEDLLYQEFKNKILYDALNVVVQYRKFKVLRKSLQLQNSF